MNACFDSEENFVRLSGIWLNPKSFRRIFQHEKAILRWPRQLLLFKSTTSIESSLGFFFLWLYRQIFHRSIFAFEQENRLTVLTAGLHLRKQYVISCPQHFERHLRESICLYQQVIISEDPSRSVTEPATKFR